MKLRRDSKLVRWAFLLDTMLDCSIPPYTSLCAIFWRTFLWTPLLVAGALAVLTLLGLVLYGFVLSIIYGWVIWLITLGSVAIAWAIFAWLNNSTDGGFEKHPLIKGAIAVKQRFCPLVDLE